MLLHRFDGMEVSIRAPRAGGDVWMAYWALTPK